MLVMPAALAAVYVAAKFLSTAPPWDDLSAAAVGVVVALNVLRIHTLGCSLVVSLF